MTVEHGEHIVNIQGNIIYTKVIGSFNELGVKSYTDPVISVVKKLERKRFAILVDNTELEGATPEAYQLLESYNLWLNQQNMIAKALVFNIAIMATITKRMTDEELLEMFEFINRLLKKHLAESEYHKLFLKDDG